MRIQTPKETRREMAQQISERLGIPARYSGAPSPRNRPSVKLSMPVLQSDLIKYS